MPLRFKCGSEFVRQQAQRLRVLTVISVFNYSLVGEWLATAIFNIVSVFLRQQA
ncbi:hypothetical protein H5187_18460 [Pseudoalteromonas sp. SG44-1]|uniref:hypothetical protein n=1 Tax=Pseudoalteromonas sp. SG44-1 TaxID=2760964 RepID=UPI0016014E30|nr:hypothetical protein [Pseudoalteromonas sp. SG44-1]MBB1419234.1 hypothetical protein [Pseudoalteromonas sp. SG44-1]